MKQILKSLPLFLLLILCLTVAAGCTTPPDTPSDGDTTVFADTQDAVNTEAATQPTATELVVDGQGSILIPADSDEILKKAADRVAALVGEKASLTLPVVSADSDGPSCGIRLALGEVDGEHGYDVTVSEDMRIMSITASDATTLYFAAEAVLETWLTPDFGLTAEGVLTLPVARVAELNHLTTRRDRSIKVLTQNVRYTDDGNGNTVQNRSQRFMQMLEEYQPDLIGGQEYTHNWNIWLTKLTQKAGGEGVLGGYGIICVARNGSSGIGDEANPIFYRLDRFELLETETFWLSNSPERVSRVEQSINYRICTWALLKDKLTGETILFANTHLDHSTDVVRGKQMEILMNYLADRVGQYTTYLTGDFNCSPDSTPYGIVTASLSDSHKTAWVDHSTVSATYHDYTDAGYEEIDFIFHNDGATPISYEIISKKYGGFVSDHYGVIAEFVHD